MRYIIIPIIALGLTLSLIVGIEYNCIGPEMFPTYYGSPFVFMYESPGSSMTYYYTVSGLLLNIGVWSLVLIFLRYAFLKLKEMSNHRNVFKISYIVLASILVLFALLNIGIAYVELGGFDWYWNLNQEAKDWGVHCEGKWKFLIIH